MRPNWTVRAYDRRCGPLAGSEGSRGVIASADASLRRFYAPPLLTVDGARPTVVGTAWAVRWLRATWPSKPAGLAAAWAQPVDALALSSPALAATLSTGQQ